MPKKKKDRLGVNVGEQRRRSNAPSDDGRRQSLAPPAGGGRRRSATEDEDDFDDMDMQPIEVRRKPPDQVEGLTEEQLGETFTKMIGGGDPNLNHKMAQFSHESGCYTSAATTDHLAVHFSMDGVLIAGESEEAKAQAERKENYDGDVIKNQFNFSERGTQCFINPMRSKEIRTEPPPTGEFVGQVSQWEIFDTYLEEFERKIMIASVQENKKKKKNDEDEEDAQVEDEPTDVFETEKFARAMKIMERMVHTNFESKEFNFFKYYEDKNEMKKEDGRGSFMPLWKFDYEKAGRKNVTSIRWNPEFTDLFAVGFGSYDFVKQGDGMVCCFSLKNTSHPEFVFEMESGVMCLDFNKDHSSLLCVGMYDGTVAVYDLRKKDNKPIFISNSPKTKHTDPVWEVYWGKEDANKGINFYSVSSDGHVANWVLAKTELDREEVVTLKLHGADAAEASGANSDVDFDSTMLGLAGGCCFDFNPSDPDTFLVGTEEGAIQSYSKAYNAEFLRAFTGHHMAIYSVEWNKFHPNVFLSCSADWTVKLWESNTSKPVMTFDLNTAVGDVAWSPFSSTVFATITTDGRVRVYDLNVNKHEPIGDFQKGKKSKLTKICFNPIEPIVCVGDDRGVVTILKLSNNLRKMSASKIEDINVQDEIDKLDRVMIMPEKDEENIASLLEAANKGNTNIGKEPEFEKV